MDAKITKDIAIVADRMLENEDAVVRDMDAAVRELVPALYADAAIASECSASNRANLRRYLTIARQADQPPPVEVPPEALDIARTVVRRGIEVPAVFQGYRAGQQVVCQRWMQAVVSEIEPGSDVGPVLERSLTLLFGYVDDVLAQVVAEAQRERDQVVSGELARRAETMRLILADAPLTEADASRRLGYELARSHTAVVLWAESAVPPEDLEKGARALAGAGGDPSPLTMSAGVSTLWVWIGTTTPPSLDDLRKALVATPESVRAAVGPTERGMEGFRRSHDAAVGVHRLLAGQVEGERFATYAELEVTALAARDEHRAAEFIAATLGPLAADEPNAARLRETLRVFLEEADNAPRAAVRLHTHRNTVLQRVARATDLLGHDVGERRLALSLALELTHRLGPRVLLRAS